MMLLVIIPLHFMTVFVISPPLVTSRGTPGLMGIIPPLSHGVDLATLLVAVQRDWFEESMWMKIDHSGVLK
jgi:hypothetical protein